MGHLQYLWTNFRRSPAQNWLPDESACSSARANAPAHRHRTGLEVKLDLLREGQPASEEVSALAARTWRKAALAPEGGALKL